MFITARSMGRNFVAVFMAFILTQIPALASAEVAATQLPAQGMIATQVLVGELQREQAEKEVRDFLTREDVQKQLADHGVNADEVSQRLATLSDYELQKLGADVQEARFGGDILVAILLVVLIIFLIKRI